ncbi:hypothetical protein IIB34_02435 [PVC group bacterium]|nr:hypothetical protein [PVC group bacterium]
MDSGDETILELGIDKSNPSIHTGSRLEENRTAIRLIKESGAHLHFSLIFGSPGESNDSCQRSLEFMHWAIDVLGTQLDTVESDIWWVNYGAPCSQVFEEYSYAQELAIKAGKEISTSALEAFLDSTGATVLEMKSDADKLVLYVGERKSVQQEDITLLLSGESAHDVFELTDAVSQRNLRRTLMILHHLFHQGKSSIELVGWLSWHFRRVWMTKSLLDKKISPFQISKRVHIGQRYFSDFAKNAAQISHEHLHRIFQSLLSTDCAMKSSFWDDRLLLETLSGELCA